MGAGQEREHVGHSSNSRVGFQDTGELIIRMGDLTAENIQAVVLSSSNPAAIVSEQDLGEAIWARPGDFGTALREMNGQIENHTASPDRETVLIEAANRLGEHLNALAANGFAE